MLLSPNQVRFTQSSISGYFQNGNSINETILRVVLQEIRQHDFPPIRVIPWNNAYYSQDNRRLYVFRVLHKLEMLDWIDVKQIPLFRVQSNHWTTTNGGCHVKVRNKATTFHHCSCNLRNLPDSTVEVDDFMDVMQSTEDDHNNEIEKQAIQSAMNDNNGNPTICHDDSESIDISASRRFESSRGESSTEHEIEVIEKNTQLHRRLATLSKDVDWKNLEDVLKYVQVAMEAIQNNPWPENDESFSDETSGDERSPSVHSHHDEDMRHGLNVNSVEGDQWHNYEKGGENEEQTGGELDQYGSADDEGFNRGTVDETNRHFQQRSVDFRDTTIQDEGNRHSQGSYNKEDSESSNPCTWFITSCCITLLVLFVCFLLLVFYFQKSFPQQVKESDEWGPLPDDDSDTNYLYFFSFKLIDFLSRTEKVSLK